MNTTTTGLMSRVPPLIVEGAKSISLAGILNAVLVIIVFIVLVSALAYKQFSKEGDKGIKDKYYNGLVALALATSLISVLVGIWFLILSQSLKKNTAT